MRWLRCPTFLPVRRAGLRMSRQEHGCRQRQPGRGGPEGRRGELWPGGSLDQPVSNGFRSLTIGVLCHTFFRMQGLRDDRLSYLPLALAVPVVVVAMIVATSGGPSVAKSKSFSSGEKSAI